MRNYNWEGKEQRKAAAIAHTQYVSQKYEKQIEDCINKSKIYGPDFDLPVFEPSDPHGFIVDIDSVGGAFLFQEGKTAILNFASHKNPGGMFIEGSRAQEECLCHESCLYNVLLKFPQYYAWNQQNLKKGHVQSCGCEKSIGELKISQLLLQYNIPFERQKTFETCRYEKTNKLLFFNFFVNNQYLIEFDGIQHFQSGDNWNTEERFKKQQEYDNIKNKWCIDNDIPLIRIPYWKLSTLTIEDLLLK